jgi:hypothetical protein
MERDQKFWNPRKTKVWEPLFKATISAVTNATVFV